MSSFTDRLASLTAEELIAYIANDYYELSHDKVRMAYTNYKAACKGWLEKNYVEPVADTSFHDGF